MLLSLFLISVPSAVVALQCYSCSYSVLKLTPENDFFCVNESLIKSDRNVTTRICPPRGKFCITTVETSLKAFSAVTRTCGDTCREPCESNGYGIDMVKCDDCCTEDFCNNNYSVRYYLELLKQQHTSWFKPPMGEKVYNRINNGFLSAILACNLICLIILGLVVAKNRVKEAQNGEYFRVFLRKLLEIERLEISCYLNWNT